MTTLTAPKQVKKIEVLTSKLRCGTLVFAKKHKEYGINAATYSNWTQANNMSEKLQQQSVNCFVFQSISSRVFFIKIV
jgi:hypothetical protein